LKDNLKQVVAEYQRRILHLWVVYKCPSDFPEDYVARRFDNGAPTEVILKAETLGGLRVLLAFNYPDLSYFPRHPDDDPVIVETWM
jgi:hypothetical protein